MKLNIREIQGRLYQKSVTFSVRMDEKLKKKIDLSARKNGVTSNRLIKTILEHYTAKDQKLMG